MPELDIDGIISEIYKDTHELWNEYKKYMGPAQHFGFKILYGPATLEPSVFIVGLQPGGDDLHATDDERMGPPSHNEYLSQSWILANVLRRRLGIKYLERSVGANVNFFRAPNWEFWTKKVSPLARDRLESFSLYQLRRLISVLKPTQILILGWEAMFQLVGGSFEELLADKMTSSGRRRLLKAGSFEGIPAFAIPHPSSAWRNPPVTDSQWEAIAEKLGAARGHA